MKKNTFVVRTLAAERLVPNMKLSKVVFPLLCGPKMPNTRIFLPVAKLFLNVFVVGKAS